VEAQESAQRMQEELNHKDQEAMMGITKRLAEIVKERTAAASS
jgi:hypothetical protein